MSTIQVAAPTHRSSENVLVWLVVGLFFIWGGATSLNDILIPKLKALFALSYTEVMLTQFAFFTAYFLVSVPAGMLVSRLGYVRGLVVGLGIMALGALLFWPAAASGVYWSFLVALFVLAGGITILQVAANPLITTLGDAAGASSRLTFAQAFNSLGTTVWPYIGAQLILGSVASIDPTTVPTGQLGAVRAAETAVIGNVYLAIALVLGCIAMIFWTQRDVLPRKRTRAASVWSCLALLVEPRILFGTIALFVYVGAEVSIGSILVNYLEEPSTLAMTAQRAGGLLSFYWGGAMVGRFVGAWLLNRFNPGKLLASFACFAGALVMVSMAATGEVAGWSLISVGLFNSIMFPTIFSLSVEGQGVRVPEVSGLLCMAIVGGAIIPILTGRIADAFSIVVSLLVPVMCYGCIAAFGLYSTRSVES